MPVGYEPLDQKFRDGILHGSFTVAGNAYNIRKLCVNVIDYLEEHGVEFHWRNPISLVDGGDRVTELPPGDIVWASGVSGGMSSFLADKKILLQGVLGCWVDIPNQGFSHPFKIYGKEPTNFINATPIGNRLLLSGGYGWVGTRAHAEVTKLAKPTMQAFLHEVSKFFFDGRALSDKYPLATCIRPSLPSGVTQIEEITYQDRRVVTCIGHSAGGFTQSAHVADVVVEKLSS
jgi:glycine/D-amino acid oxidase-like deaminating enzyme